MHRAFVRVGNPFSERMVSVFAIVCSCILVFMFSHVWRLQGPVVEPTPLVDGALLASAWNQLHTLYSVAVEEGGRLNDHQKTAFALLCMFGAWMGGMGLVVTKLRRKVRALENKLATRTEGFRDVTQQLEREKMNRQQTEDNLRRTQAEVDQGMRERFSQLQQVNAALSQEIAEWRRGGDRQSTAGTETLERPIRADVSKCNEGEFLSYSVSHDLRAPLKSINGFSQALLDDCGSQLDEKARNYVLHVREAGHRMDNLIGGMLNLARYGRETLNLRPMDLTGLARSVMEACQQAEPDRHVDWVNMEDLTATGDFELLRVVLENLIGNSWKYTKQTQYPRIEFGVTYHYAQPVYYVRDNGAGFDMTYADKLFRIFQRLHDRKDFPGNGIGLATVHRIIGRHGGKVWAEAAVNSGATFFFTLEPQAGTV